MLPPSLLSLPPPLHGHPLPPLPCLIHHHHHPQMSQMDGMRAQTTRSALFGPYIIFFFICFLFL
ncbi:hypothetical protein L208DRAFT_1412218 [Tricholoma matsutake]|nr:hypothetical protein L208DRAFT_1412218 [Tricholoma matsutake 945]